MKTLLLVLLTSTLACSTVWTVRVQGHEIIPEPHCRTCALEEDRETHCCHTVDFMCPDDETCDPACSDLPGTKN